MQVNYEVWLRIEEGDVSDSMAQRVAKEIAECLKVEQQVDVFSDGEFRGCVMDLDCQRALKTDSERALQNRQST